MILIYTILITSALFHFGSRARVTSFIWSRYPLALARFMDCAMCSGAWYGIAIAIVALSLGYDYPGLEDQHALVACFFGSAVWTPIVAGLVQHMMGLMGMRQSIIDEMVERGLIDPKEASPDEPTAAAVAEALQIIESRVPPPCEKCKTKLLSPNGIHFACPKCDPSAFDVDTGRPT